MTRFEVVRAIYGVDEFSALIFALAQEAGSPEKLTELLSVDMEGPGLQFTKDAARDGTYPISFLKQHDSIEKERELLEEYLHMEYDRLDQCSTDAEHSTPKTGCESEWNDINERIDHIVKILKLVNTEAHALDEASRKGAAAVAESLLNESASAYVYGDADSAEVRIIDEIHRNLIATFKVRIASHFLMFEEYQFFDGRGKISVGKYEQAVKKVFEGKSQDFIEYEGTKDTALISAGVLDFIAERDPELSLKGVLIILKDAEDILMQIITQTHGI